MSWAPSRLQFVVYAAAAVRTAPTEVDDGAAVGSQGFIDHGQVRWCSAKF